MASSRSDELNAQHHNTSQVRLDLVDGVPTGEDALYECDGPLSHDSPDRLQRRARYEEELKQIEDEIETLRQVLIAKYRRHSYLKSQLGITLISELRSEVNKGVENLKTSETFQKTSAVVKSAKDKTSAVLLDKWQALKQTNTFKSLEDKVSAVYSTVRLSPHFNQLALAGPAATVMGKLIPSATVSEVSQSAHLPASSEATGSTLSGQNRHVDKVDASNPMTSATTTVHQGNDVSIVPLSSPAENLTRFDSLSADNDSEDEVDEFTLAMETVSKRDDLSRPAVM